MSSPVLLLQEDSDGQAEVLMEDTDLGSRQRAKSKLSKKKILPLIIFLNSARQQKNFQSYLLEHHPLPKFPEDKALK